MIDSRDRLNWAHSLLVFIGGGLLISLGDRSHIEFGVLVQDDTSFFGQAWWVVPMFGVVSLTLLYAYRALRRRFNEPAVPRSLNRTALNGVLFLAAYCSTGPFAHFGFWLAVALTGLWALRVLLYRENRSTIALSLLIAILGPIGEIMVAMMGMFHYTNPDFGSVHSWLPAVYLHGGLVVASVDAFLTSKRHPEPMVSDTSEEFHNRTS